MYFQVNRNLFLKALTTVSHAAIANSPLPVLCGIKMTCEDDQLVLMASDSNISIKAILKKSDEKNSLMIYDKGSCVIDYRYITELTRKAEGELISLEIIDGTLIKIVSGFSEYKLNGIPSEDYPNINFNYGSDTFTFKTSLFKEIIEETSFACSDKNTRPALTGVNLSAKNFELTVNATDSYRLATKKISIDKALDFNITIPAKYLIEVNKTLEGDGDIILAIDQQKVAFIFDDVIIQTRLIEDAYPDTSKLIPETFSHTLKVRSRDVLNAIDRSSFIKSDGKNIIKLNISGESLHMSSSSQEIGSSNENIAIIQFEGLPLQISCSGRYLADGIRALKSDKIVMRFNGDLKPIIITQEDDGSLIQLISPVRTYN